jgi:amino acid transporter
MENPICPKCHTTVRSSDFFCFNCGTNLKPKPLNTTLSYQLLLYIGCILLPPLGIIWGIRYLKEPKQSSKIIGIISIILTLISLIVGIILSINIINNVNSQVSKQLQLLNNY